MAFKPAKIEKIRLIIPKKHYSSVASLLGRIGVMQVEVLAKESKGFLGGYMDDRYGYLSECSRKIRGFVSALPEQKTDRKVSFKSVDEAARGINKIKAYNKVSELKKQQERAAASINYSDKMLALLEKFHDLDFDIGILDTQRTASFFVSGKEAERFIERLSQERQVIQRDKSEFLLVIPKAYKDELIRLSNGFKVSLEPVPSFKGSVKSNIKRQYDIKNRAQTVISRTNAALLKISKKYYAIASALKEEIDIEISKLDLLLKAGSTDFFIVLEGWADQKEIEKIDSEIGKATAGVYLLERIHTEETPPTKFSNPISFRLYEFFIKFYSIPKSTEIDPTIFFGIAFPVFFGLMVGDFGYGLVMLLGALLVIRHIRHPPKKSHIPTKIRKFIHTIMSDNSMLMISKAIIPGSIIAMALGIVFNEFFGFHLGYVPLFNLTSRVATLLVISGWTGVGMVSFGFVLGALNRYYSGDLKGTAGRIGWILVAWAIVILGLDILHRTSIGPSNPGALASYAMFIVGLATVLKTEGFESILEIPSVISHILSYTRLVGILLASVILADVVNTVFLSTLSSPVLLILGVLILVVGQIFNIIIAIFEAGIQGARLIYVEFLSKFFSGNGRLFTPFKITRNRTVFSPSDKK